MSYYKNKYGYKKNNYLNASEISDYSISIPVGPHLNRKEVIYVINNLKKELKKLNEKK